MIEAGRSLLHYRLVEKLGEGGMGVVWKAVDTTLDREVAIKFLPDLFVQDAERLARFEREAKLLASLEHPNIAAVYGLHEAEGLRFMAMELVAGEDLQQRLERGPIPPDEACDIAGQIAAALEAAHDSGVVHRDLKPANVRLSPDGRVCVLDFGLAKVVEAGQVSGHSPKMSPTVTSAGTAAGMILGTTAYMSPEQARGKPVDRRTDVWSFGCVLYEMLAGRAAFRGETVTDVLASIVQREPDWSALPSNARRVIERCLRKDVRDRLRDMGDVGLLLRETWDEPVNGATPAAASNGPARWIWPGVATLLFVVLGFLYATGRIAGAPATGAESGAALVTEMAPLTDLPGTQHSPALSPDGRQLLYVADDGGDEDIFLQRVGGENPINLTADFDDDDFQPAFSPDGERVAFCSRREGGGIFLMGATGEAPTRVSDQGFDPTWSPDGRKLAYTTERVLDPYARSGIAFVSIVDLGTRESRRLVEFDSAGPTWSPTGRRIAFWTHYAEIQGQRDIVTVDVADGRTVFVTKDVHTDWDPFWSPDGEWLYFISDRGGSPDLWRVRIDETTGETHGPLRPVTTGIASLTQASLSADGRRVAVTTERETGSIVKVGFDAATERVSGEPMTLVSSSSSFRQPAVSSDGLWLAYCTTAPEEGLYIMRPDGTSRRKLLSDEHRNRGPMWHPGGEWISFYSNRDGSYNAWAIRTDGTGLKKLTAGGKVDVGNGSWWSDGRRMLVTGTEEVGWTGWVDVGEAGLAGLEEPPEIHRLPGSEYIGGRFLSPDEKDVAGAALNPLGEFSLAVYSIDEEKLDYVRQEDGRYVLTLDVAWIDSHRVIGWEFNRDVAVIWDLERRELRTVPGVPGPGEIVISPDDRSLFVNRTELESDVWLLTLAE